MLDGRMLYDATSNEEPVLLTFSGSSVQAETGLDSALAQLRYWLHGARRTGVTIPYSGPLRALLEIDSSTVSVDSPFKILSRDSLVESFVKEAPAEEPVEYDVYVRLSPLEEYSMWVEIETVEQGVPRIVEPEEY